MLRYLATRGIPGVEAIDLQQQTYARSVRIENAEGWLRVRNLEEKNQLELEVAPQLAPHLMFLLSQVRTQFDLDANPAVIESHLMQDPLLAPQVRKVPGLRVPGTFDVFELAVRAVLGQQVSVAGATTLSGRVVQRFGDPIVTPIAGVTHHFPKAQVLADAVVEDIIKIGMPTSRAETIRNIARFAVDGGLSVYPTVGLQQAFEQMKSVRGIGEWTAQYIAMRALRFPDAFPAGDLGLQKAAAETPGGRLTEKQLLARAADWSPWRGYAALILWNLLSNPVTI
jgi:AraC family transcriptional regulator of adaptative response / DNA-3-methyladenine glycosylase II